MSDPRLRKGGRENWRWPKEPVIYPGFPSYTVTKQDEKAATRNSEKGLEKSDNSIRKKKGLKALVLSRLRQSYLRVGLRTIIS